MIHIRTMTNDDLPLGMSLTRQVGWNQTEADWQRFLALSARGCFVGEIAGRPLGTVATFAFGDIGWIAMVLVHSEARGRGLGQALTDHALRHLEQAGMATVRLDATPLGQPIYQKLGFARAYQLHRYHGIFPKSSAPTSDHPAAFPSPAGQLPDLCAVDRTITGTDRHALLELLYREQPNALLTAYDDARLTGYVTARPGRHAWQIGPAVAETAPVGCALLDAAAARHADQPVFIDMPADNVHANNWARQHGLTVQRSLLRMTHGQPVSDRIDKLWASSGPEKG